MVILFGSMQVQAFAKDKPADASPAPTWTTEQKLAYVTAQLDAARAQLRTVPTNCQAAMFQSHVDSLAKEYNKGIDLAKWQQNPETLEFTPIPETPKPDAQAAPAEKKP